MRRTTVKTRIVSVAVREGGPSQLLRRREFRYGQGMRSPVSLVLASFAVLATFVSVALIAGCDNAASPGPQDPTMVQNGGGTGPLANLEASAFQNEVWINEQGQQVGFLYYPNENVRISAQCRTAAGQFVCDAMRFMRSGMPVEIARRALDGRTSAGVKVCQRMNQPIVIVHNSVGSEDSFCRFPDGSLVANGALEQYKMRVIQ